MPPMFGRGGYTKSRSQLLCMAGVAMCKQVCSKHVQRRAYGCERK